MKAKDIMTTAVKCISPDMRIQDAAKEMKTLDVGFLPVCESERLIGTLTDRDIALRVVGEGKNPQDCKARDVMTSDVYWCYDDQTADEVADFMAEKEVRRVLILNRNKRLAGVISIGDLSKARGEQEKAGKTLKEIAEAPSQVA
jgi:CBS domain-containing protein